ncbi:sensor histidine kinase [Terriglobus roseus]|uniref:sensor histidine kinase n=1 Tax=Terriglobus roseus TaxID=392734 RepID=UPI0015614650|nr:sensor histidine kinase [Terriglobus roseus]
MLSAFPSHEGGVWLVTRTAGMLLWRDERLQEFPDRRCTPTVVGDGIAEGHDGSLWMQAAAGLSHLSGTTCKLLGPESGVPKGMPASVFVDDKGVVWVKTSNGSLLVRQTNSEKFQLWGNDALPASSVAHMHQAPDRSIWISDQSGIRQLTTPTGTPTHSAPVTTLGDFTAPFGDFTFEKSGNLWIAARGGLIQLPGPQPLQSVKQMKAILPSDGLSSSTNWRPFVDESGGLWIGTNGGLDNFHRTLLKPLTTQGRSEDEFAVVAAGDKTWFGNATTELTSLTKDGVYKTYPAIKSVLTLRRDALGRIWCASSSSPRLSYVESETVHVVNYPEEDSEPILSIAFDRGNNPWIMTRGGDVFRFSEGAWQDQSNILKKRPGVLGAMTSDGDGNIWIAFSNKLFQWDGAAYHQSGFQDASLNVSVATMAVKNRHVWLAGRGGLVLFKDGAFRKPTWQDRDFPGRISGVVESSDGDLWLNTFSGGVHVAASEVRDWISSNSHAFRALRLDSNDGLPGLSSERIPEPSLVESLDGDHLLFATTKDIASLSLADFNAKGNRIPPSVAIVSVTASGKKFPISSSVRIPPRPARLTIAFTALGANDPARVRFRYHLSGVDENWQDAGMVREASYTKLAPGSHQFEVIASEDGQHWSSVAAVQGLIVVPAFYQTWWFRGLLVLVGVSALFGMLQLRLHQERERLHRLHMERLSERERIARELHDTLLQGIFALTLQLKALSDGMPSGSATKLELDKAIDSSDKVIAEGRDRVRSLRMVKSEHASLQERIRHLSAELAAGSGLSISVLVEGKPTELLAETEEEILLVVTEAMRNAVIHAKAHSIQISLRYALLEFQAVVADDGIGIPEDRIKAEVLVNHWGLQGMKERARTLRGTLDIHSQLSRGTTITITVPASRVYRQVGLGQSWSRNLRAAFSRAIY